MDEFLPLPKMSMVNLPAAFKRKKHKKWKQNRDFNDTAIFNEMEKPHTDQDKLFV